MTSARGLLPLALVFAVAAPAGAHHRQTPPVLQFTTSGDTPLPRASAQGTKVFTLAVQSGTGKQVITISPFRDPDLQVPVGAPGNNVDPAISFNGKRVAFATNDDPLHLGMPGEQLVLGVSPTTLVPLTQDASGTSTNPVVDTAGLFIAFESAGDLAGTGHPGILQVYVRQPDGSVQQASTGLGTSRNAVLSPKKHRLAFESTSDPTTGADTGISQIWLGDLIDASAARLTAGLGQSRNPALSDDGVLAVESTANLADNGADTGVSQIFTYDPKSQTFAQITNDAGGCTLPGVSKVKRDWRITFVCSGLPYYYMLRADQRFQVQTGGGVTQRILGEMGIHFLILSTTGNLLGGGPTPGKQVYMVNLFKRPADPVPGLAHWFPTRGIPPL